MLYHYIVHLLYKRQHKSAKLKLQIKRISTITKKYNTLCVRISQMVKSYG